MSQLTQPVRLIATTFVPDSKSEDNSGRAFGLILQGECLYVLAFLNPQITRDESTTFLGEDPVEFMLYRYYPENALPAYAHANEQGYLYFREEDEVALAWFTEHFSAFGGEITLVRN